MFCKHVQLIRLLLEAGRGLAHLAALTGTSADDTLVDSGLDAVEHLDVELGEGVVLVGGSLADVTEGGGIDNVTDDEPLDGLVLGDGLSGGNAPDTLDVSPSLLVTSVSPSFDSHIV